MSKPMTDELVDQYEEQGRYEGELRLIDCAKEIRRLREWVNDLHSGMYINCVYCGHRYGPNSEVPASMADVLKAHVEKCPAHPMSKLREENERARELLEQVLSSRIPTSNPTIRDEIRAFLDGEKL